MQVSAHAETNAEEPAADADVADTTAVEHGMGTCMRFAFSVTFVAALGLAPTPTSLVSFAFFAPLWTLPRTSSCFCAFFNGRAVSSSA